MKKMRLEKQTFVGFVWNNNNNDNNTTNTDDDDDDDLIELPLIHLKMFKCSDVNSKLRITDNKYSAYLLSI